MKQIKAILCGVAVLCAASFGAKAVTVDLAEWTFNIDGVISDSGLGDPVPAGVDLASFDTATGLGSIAVAISGAGAHYVGIMLDHEIDELINTFFNEVGAASGSPGAGQSWEIDEPGWGNSGAGYVGDIYDNLLIGSLDNSVGTANPEDVAMAMAWDFILDSTESASITLVASLTTPASGFYLRQIDRDSDATVYLSGSLRISGGGGGDVPDGGSSLGLLIAALGGMALFRGFGRKQ